MSKLKYRYLWFTLLITLVLACSRQEKAPSRIVAKIADREIYLDEFHVRAEYTPRPHYCNRDNYIHKKIILNSLVAEKLLALEAGKDNELMQNQEFKAYLQGRKEQAMRQWLFLEEGYKKIDLDKESIQNLFNLAKRRYNVSYMTLQDSVVCNKVKEKVNEGGSLHSIYQQFGGLEQLPRREIEWQHKEHSKIIDALFEKSLSQNEIIGPIQTDTDQYLYLQIEGWTERLLVSEAQQHELWELVSNRLHSSKALQQYERFVQKIMRNKKVDFNRDTFFQLAGMLEPYYLKSSNEKKELFNNQYWGKTISDKGVSSPELLEELKEQPLLILNEETVWTVDDLYKEIKSHPLVFRKQRISKSDFPEQLKLAIVDLIRDKHLTREAYDRGYEKIPEIQHNVRMWQDNLVAMYQRNQYLKKHNMLDEFNQNPVQIIDNHMNKYIDQLQSKYSDQVEIDTDLFENIKLSKIDMFAYKQSAPYPIVSPNFPILTTDHTLDYGRKMNQD